MVVVAESKVRSVASRTMAGIAAVEAVRQVAKDVAGKYRARRTWVTTVQSNDDLYRPVLQAVLDRLPVVERRAVEAMTSRSNEPHDSVGRSRDDVRFVYSGQVPSRIVLDGHTVTVSVDAGERKEGDLTWSAQVLRFRSGSVAGHDAVARFLVDVADRRRQVPTLRLASRWGSWQQRNDLPARSMSTVALEVGVAERLVGDMRRFVESEQLYAETGAPWHRCYLFSGPPGTGKTSLARALASEFGLDVYYLPLSDMSADSSLLELVSAVPPRSLLLLEDIDAAAQALDRSDDVPDHIVHTGPTSKSSIAGLLNAIDGVFTPHGLVTVMTSNYPDRLDAALLRPGRMNLRLELGFAGQGHVDRLWSIAGFPAPAPVLPHDRCSPAAIIDVLLEHQGDRHAAADAIGAIAPSTWNASTPAS